LETAVIRWTFAKKEIMKKAERIKELRIQKGMTQEELAEKTEVTTRTIQRIENGHVEPRAYTLQMIAKALEVDYSVFQEAESVQNQENQYLDHKNQSALLHFTGILPLLFPTYLVWRNTKNKNNFLASHYRASVTLQLCILFICLGSLWVFWKTNLLIPLIGSLFAGILTSIMNTIFVINDKPIINPFIQPQGNPDDREGKA